MNISDPSLILVQLAVLAYAVPLSIVFWVLFKRAGRPGWLSLIPFYNLYVMGSIAMKSKLGIASSLGLLLLFVLLSSPLKVEQLFILLVSIPTTVCYLLLFVTFIKRFDTKFIKWLIVPFIPLTGLVFLSSAKKYRAKK
jgi:hypothetical protein